MLCLHVCLSPSVYFYLLACLFNCDCLPVYTLVTFNICLSLCLTAVCVLNKPSQTDNKTGTHNPRNQTNCPHRNCLRHYVNITAATDLNHSTGPVLT